MAHDEAPIGIENVKILGLEDFGNPDNTSYTSGAIKYSGAKVWVYTDTGFEVVTSG